MTVREIRIYGDPVLRTPCAEITDIDDGIRALVVPGVGRAQPVAGGGVHGGARRPRAWLLRPGCRLRPVHSHHVRVHGRTRSRRSAKRRSPMPLTSRSSSTERKPPCWVR